MESQNGMLTWGNEEIFWFRPRSRGTNPKVKFVKKIFPKNIFWNELVIIKSGPWEKVKKKAVGGKKMKNHFISVTL